MIELIQFPWSPFCIVQRRILEFAGVRFKITNIPNQDRSLVWKLTKQRYYGVPIIRDGKNVVFELNDDSQVIAKYLDAKFQLGLFPFELEGVQSILWRYIENEIEGATFRLNDIYWREIVPPAEQLDFLRHKERKFGRGCIDQWRAQQSDWLEQLEQRLVPFEEMAGAPSLFCWGTARASWISICSACWKISFTPAITSCPPAHKHLRDWHRRISKLKGKMTK